MQSAATYAELALLAGSWEPYDIERHIFGRDWNKEGPYKSRGTFYSARDGGNINRSQLRAIQSLFPNSHLEWWRRHPIAQILCDARLGQDGVLDALKTLPDGPERQCIWDEGSASLFTCTLVARELPDSVDVIERLADMRTPFALLALIGRMRLAQLRAADSYIDVEYEKALLHVLPNCIACSPHLVLGHEALLEAVWRFLWWSPHAESRHVLQMHDKDGLTWSGVERRISRAIHLISWPGLTLPPADQLQSRKNKVAKIIQSTGKA